MRVVLLNLMLLSNIALGQTLNDGWAYVTKDVNGKSFHFNSTSLIKEGWPPNSVAVKVAAMNSDGKAEGYRQYEFNCREQQVKIDQSNFIPISGDTNTIRKQLMLGFCGVQEQNGLWFLAGANNSSTNPNQIFTWFLDAYSLRKTQSPLPNGVTFRYGQPAFNAASPPYFKNQFNAQDVTVSCSEPRFIYKNQSGENQELTIARNSILWSVQHLVCNGYFNISEVSTSAPPSSGIGLDRAKEQCKELGFKSGTEAFGNCVLKLSR